MNKNKGFTLIEMMVVIAIIGFLSAAILVAVGNARKKAKDSTIISGIQEAAGIAESYYDTATGNYTDPQGDATWGGIETKVQNIGLAAFDLKWVGAQNTYRVYGALMSGGVYCVDVEGTSKIMPAAPTHANLCAVQ